MGLEINLLGNRGRQKSDLSSKRFLRLSEACDYYNLGLVYVRHLVQEVGALYRIPGAPLLIEREKLDQYIQKFRES